MAGNTIYVSGNYVDVHDNEVVNLSIDKAVLTGVPQTEAAEEVNGQTEAEEPQQELNCFAPRKNITALLCMDWFDEASSNKAKFTVKWREEMMESLMNTEYGREIAKQWTEPGRRLQVKCALIGALVDVGVIKGSYNSLAPRLDIHKVADASLAKYMGYGKKQPYFDWLKEYVNS